MNDKPISRGIGEAAVLVKPILLADQYLWIGKVSLHRTLSHSTVVIMSARRG